MLLFKYLSDKLPPNPFHNEKEYFYFDFISIQFIEDFNTSYLLDCLGSLLAFNKTSINDVLSKFDVVKSLYCELLKLYVICYFNEYIIIIIIIEMILNHSKSYLLVYYILYQYYHLIMMVYIKIFRY